MPARLSRCSRSPPPSASCCSPPSGRCAADGSRSRRAAGRDQCRRSSACDGDHPCCRRPRRLFWATRCEKIATEKAGILKRETPAIVAAQARDVLAVIERQAATAPCAAEDRRRGLDCHRGARPAGLSGDARPAGSAGAEAHGHHRFENAGLAIAALRAIKPFEDFAGRLRGRNGQGRLAGAAAAACRSGRLVDLAPAGSELWLDGGHDPDGAALSRRRSPIWRARRRVRWC